VELGSLNLKTSFIFTFVPFKIVSVSSLNRPRAFICEIFDEITKVNINFFMSLSPSGPLVPVTVLSEFSKISVGNSCYI
jgi:hypothetical protein